MGRVAEELAQVAKELDAIELRGMATQAYEDGQCWPLVEQRAWIGGMLTQAYEDGHVDGYTDGQTDAYDAWQSGYEAGRIDAELSAAHPKPDEL